jgi:phosphatidylglycerophosphate synthase
MVLERYRAGWGNFLTPAARQLHRWRISPNALTVVSLLFALGAALAFGFATRGRSWLLLVGAAAVAINAILDGLDGKLARLSNQETKRGDFLDHVVDRYSDAAILLGLTLSPLGSLTWGVFALVGTFLTSYMGTQAQALGLGRMYAGWLGRADRLVILMSIPTLVWLAYTLGVAIPFGADPLVIMLAYFAVVGNLTAAQRFWSAWRMLGRGER